MSESKLKYFLVTSTSVVWANTKADAELVARGRRGVTGSLLSQETDIERLAAADARSMISENS